MKADAVVVPPITAQHSNAVAAMHRRFNIPGDVVNKATSDLPDDQRSAVRRLHAYAVEHDLSLEELGKQIGYSDTSVSLVLRGKYEADLAAFCKAVNSLLDLEKRRSKSRKLPFVKTGLYGRMKEVCDATREFQKISFFFGDMQIGKSECLTHYTEENNHGNTIYIETPTGGALIHFLTKLAEILRIGAQGRETDLRRRIIDSFDDKMLLIVDEGHRCIPSKANGVPRTALKTIDFIRELFNEKKCGVIICATNVFRHEMEEGEVKLILKQTRRRRLFAVQLENKPDRADLNKFAAEYGLTPTTKGSPERKLEIEMITDEALGMWLTLLRMAAKLKHENGDRRMTWQHVLDAHAGVLEIEGRKPAKDDEE